jgi:hypothetical protein
MTETKQITLTGGAAEELGGGKKTRKARGGGNGSRKAKKLVLDKEGAADATAAGGGTSPGTMTQLAASSVGSVNIQKVLPAAATVTDGAARVNSARPAVEPGLPAQAQAAGAPVKVVLKPKKKTARVVLAPPKKGGGNANTVEKVNVHPVAPANLSGGAKKTRKAIKVSLPGLNKKLTKAKTIRQDAAKTSVEQVKKTLHKAGLIKMDTKAPESILRQMYADFMVLKNRAL